MTISDSLDPDFLQEMQELLQQLEESVLIVENNPGDQEEINSLFRVMHSMKGSAGMFSLDAITDFTHHLESELDSVRKRKGTAEKPLIDAILHSKDLIPKMLEGDTCRSEVRAILDSLQGRVVSEHSESAPRPKKPSNEHNSYEIAFKAPSNFFETGGYHQLFNDLRESGEVSLYLRMEELPSLLDESFDPQKCYSSWDIFIETSLSKDAVEDLFIFYGGEGSDLSIKDFESGGKKEKRLGEILIERGVLSTEALENALTKQKPLGEILIESGSVKPDDISSALAMQTEQKRVSPIKESNSSIRVNAEKLDKLVDLVGEMVTAQARLLSIARETELLELQEVAETIEGLTEGLRDQTMSIRMVPIASILNGFNRLVRDLSKDLSKEISFETEGEDTELDKSVVEKLKEPLIHIIRNAADHGIESAEKRIAAGKKAKGVIKLSAYHEGTQVVIAIADDGGGLNLKAIKKKALEKGLIEADAIISDSEAAQLLCAPGFSTAEKISDISGRGVGMDVVKQSIEALRGTLIIDSIPGKSTTVYLRLPVTLAIIDGLMVSLDNASYIIPLSNVEECVDLNHEEVDHVRGRNILNLRGKAVPFIRLSEKLNKNRGDKQREQVVITTYNGVKTGVVVDEVIGSHQTVLKPLGRTLKKAREFSGATILGDGTVALILDLQYLTI